jgi:hypothetical protein
VSVLEKIVKVFEGAGSGFVKIGHEYEGRFTPVTRSQCRLGKGSCRCRGYHYLCSFFL